MMMKTKMREYSPQKNRNKTRIVYYKNEKELKIIKHEKNFKKKN